MTYAEFKNTRAEIVNDSLRLFAKGNTRALLIGKQRVLDLKDHFHATRESAV